MGWDSASAGIFFLAIGISGGCDEGRGERPGASSREAGNPYVDVYQLHDEINVKCMVIIRILSKFDVFSSQ